MNIGSFFWRGFLNKMHPYTYQKYVGVFFNWMGNLSFIFSKQLNVFMTVNVNSITVIALFKFFFVMSMGANMVKWIKYRLSRHILQNLWLKVLLKIKWFNFVLDIKFMTLNNLITYFIFFEFSINLRGLNPPKVQSLSI